MDGGRLELDKRDSLCFRSVAGGAGYGGPCSAK